MKHPNGCQIILLVILFGAPAALLVNLLLKPSLGTGLVLLLVAVLVGIFLWLERWYRKALATRYDNERSTHSNR
jgi:CBS-domain-containing membrane protein